MSKIKRVYDTDDNTMRKIKRGKENEEHTRGNKIRKRKRGKINEEKENEEHERMK